MDKYVGAIQYKNAILSKESSKGDFVAERQNECSSKVELAHQHWKFVQKYILFIGKHFLEIFISQTFDI